jgi:NarL family two-component system response regulator LiaR
MNMEQKIRVMVVDDHLVVRHGFAVFLQSSEDLLHVGAASDGLEALQLCETLAPDVILMDMIMPNLNGVETIQIIRQRYPHIQIIALTSFTGDTQLVQSALHAGAAGFLSKDISIQELARAIRSVHQGTRVLSSEATHQLIHAPNQRSPESFNLSGRELEVLKLLALGLSNNEIAERLMISRSTIKFHVSSILGKLGATSRTEAVSIAHQHRLVS